MIDYLVETLLSHIAKITAMILLIGFILGGLIILAGREIGRPMHEMAVELKALREIPDTAIITDDWFPTKKKHK